jgi:hypothetical protein
MKKRKHQVCQLPSDNIIRKVEENMGTWNASLDDIMAAQKIMTSLASRNEKKRGHKSAHKLQVNNQDLVSQSTLPSTKTMNIAPQTQTVQINQESIQLKELIDRLQQINLDMQNLKEAEYQQLVAKSSASQGSIPQPQSNQQVSQSQMDVSYSRQETITMELTYTPAQKVEGLIVHNQNQAESDRYLFTFNNAGTDFTILDKWTKHSTRVWGDPHVDLDDIQGEYNGEFSDLKSSDSHTTFMLMDGTRVTFNAKDNGLIEGVDLIKGSQHVHATGKASANWDSSGLFNTQVMTDGISSESSITRGDTIFAGGDGNDWYNASGNLVWGQTTSPSINTPPPSVLEFKMSQTITESLSIHRLEKSA